MNLIAFNRQLIFNKNFDRESTFDFDAEKKLHTELRCVTSEFKLRWGENYMFLKYQKQAITAALNGEDALMLLPTALRKS